MPINQGGQERYLVSVRNSQSGASGAARQLIWEGEQPLELGHRDSWRLERGNAGLRLRIAGGVREFPRELFENDEIVELPLVGKNGSAVLTLRRAPGLRPAYLSVAGLRDEGVSSGLRISSGTQGLFSGFRELSRKNTGRAGDRLVFVIRRKKKGYELKAHEGNLLVGFEGAPSRRLLKKERLLLSERDVETLSLGWGIHWWRLGRVVERPLAVLPQSEPSQSELESRWLSQFSKKLAAAAVAAGLLMLLLPKAPVHDEDLDPVKEEPTRIALKKPRVVEKIVAEKPVPRPPEARPEPVAPPARPVKAEKKQVAPAQPKLPPPVNPEVLRAKQTALDKARLAQSLGFLSAAKSSKAIVTSNHPDARYKRLAQAVPRDDGSPEVLSKLAAAKTPDGPIETQGARTMASQVSLGGSKTLNDVQGRVSASALASSGPPESSLSTQGMSVAGDGALAQSEIERALAKHLQRFQYCYEKALLSDSTLAGNVLIQWTIGPGGDASDVKVLKSQLNQPALHQCLSAEISRVHFPAPQGGAVLVKYPFSFSSTAL